MRVRGILTLASVAMLIVAMMPISTAADVWYSDRQSKLIDNFQVIWVLDPYEVKNADYPNDNLRWWTLFWHQDYAGSNYKVTPRLNWDSPGSEEGSNIRPDIELWRGEAAWLSGNSHVDVSSGTSLPLYNSVTYHKVDYPYTNAISQSSNMRFNVV